MERKYPEIDRALRQHLLDADSTELCAAELARIATSPKYLGFEDPKSAAAHRLGQLQRARETSNIDHRPEISKPPKYACGRAVCGVAVEIDELHDEFQLHDYGDLSYGLGKISTSCQLDGVTLVALRKNAMI